MQTDIIIIGSSLSAKIMALSLELNNFKVLLISNRIGKMNPSNLVTFFSAGSIKFLNTILENHPEIRDYESINALQCSQYEDFNKKDSILNFHNINEQLLGKIIPNKKINILLDRKISSKQNIKILNDVIIQDIQFLETKVEVFTNQLLAISAKLVIAADGKNSIIRNFTNIKFIKHDFKQTAISIIADVERKNKNIAYQFFTTDGPLALLPYQHNQSAIIWSLKKYSDELKLGQKEFEMKLNKIFKPLINNLKIISEQRFDLSFSFAKKLFSKRVALIGDSAHSIHPIAGQGLNLIIKDIDCLSRLLKKYQSLGYDLGESIMLEEYDKIRKIDNAAYSFGTLTMDELFSSKNKYIRSLTNSVFKLFDQNDTIKKHFVNSATGSNYFNNAI